MEKNRRFVKTIAICAMMFALTIIMTYTFLGTIPMPGAAASIAFLPAIITSIAFGPAGIIVAVFAGLLSLVRALMAPIGILGPYFQNPLISVLPRAMIGVTTYFSYRLLSKTGLHDTIRIGISAAIGSITNTTLVLGTLYVLYAADMLAAILASETIMAETAAAFLLGIVTTNAIGEVAVNTILAIIIISAMKKAGIMKRM